MSDLFSILDLQPAQAVAVGCVLAAAGIVRGFSGFGFSMVAVTSLSIFRSPAEIIPMVLLLEIAASLHLMITVWRDADWKSLLWLSAGMLATTPFGVLLLATMPPEVMRGVVSLLVLTAALGLLSGWRMERRPGKVPTVATGALSGFLNGAASIAGPPVILFYLSSPTAVHISRASLIAFFLGCDVIALLMGGAYGLVTSQTLIRAAVFLFPVAIGVVIGNRGFRNHDPATARRLILLLLVALSVAGLLRAVLLA